LTGAARDDSVRAMFRNRTLFDRRRRRCSRAAAVPAARRSVSVRAVSAST